MSFEELFDCADLDELRRLEREVLEQQSSAEAAQVELAVRFLVRSGSLVTHFVLQPDLSSACAVFDDGSRLWMEHLPRHEWYAVFQVALQTMHGAQTRLTGLEIGEAGCSIQFDAQGLTSLHPRRLHLD